jgi:hypothetical protein
MGRVTPFVLPTQNQTELSKGPDMTLTSWNTNIATTTQLDTSLIRRFAPALMDSAPPQGLDRRFLMDSCGDLSVYYAPFEYINPKARVVLVGITPGPTQMANAHMAARQVIMSGGSHEDAVRLAKASAAFSGTTLRLNLISQLNHWGVNSWLGINDSADLFSQSHELVQTTSLLRYPIFKDGKKYDGTPNMTRHQWLRDQLLANFVHEVNLLPNAVFLSLGPKVQEVLEVLISDGVLTPDRVLTGMLHPSGENAYRIKYMLGDRSGPTPHRTNPLPYDQGRTVFRERFLAQSRGLAGMI